MTFLLAQSLGEYGVIGDALSEAFYQLDGIFTEYILNGGPGKWLVIAGALGVLWMAFRRPR